MIARLVRGALTAVLVVSAPAAFADPEPPPLPVPLPVEPPSVEPYWDPLENIIKEACVSNYATLSGDVCVPFGESKTVQNLQQTIEESTG